MGEAACIEPGILSNTPQYVVAGSTRPVFEPEKLHGPVGTRMPRDLHDLLTEEADGAVPAAHPRSPELCSQTDCSIMKDPHSSDPEGMYVHGLSLRLIKEHEIDSKVETTRAPSRCR